MAAAEARRLALADATALRALVTRGSGALPAEAVIGAVASRARDPLYAQEVVDELGVPGLHQLVADLSARGSGTSLGTVQTLTAVVGSLVVSATAAPPEGVDPRTRRQLASSAALVGDEVVAFVAGQVVASAGRDRHAGYWLLGQSLTGARLAGDARPLPRPVLARLVTATIDAEVAETRDSDSERRHGTTWRPDGGEFFSSLFDEADTTGDALHTLLVELGDDPATQRAVLAATTGQGTIRGTRGEALSVAEYLVRRWITYEANGVGTTEGLSLATDADLARLMRSAARDGSAESAQLRSRIMAEIGRTSAWSRGEVSTVRLYESTTGAIEDAAVEWVTQMPRSVTATILAPHLVAPDVRSMPASDGHEPVLTLDELTSVVGAFAVATDFSGGGKPPAARHRRLVETELASARHAAGARSDVDAAIVRLAFYEGAGSAALMGEAAHQDAFSRRSLEELGEAKNVLLTLLRRPQQVASLAQSLLVSGTTRNAEDDFVVSLLRPDISSSQAEANERRAAATAADALLVRGPVSDAPASVNALWSAGSSAAPAVASSAELRAARRAEILAAADALLSDRAGGRLASLADSARPTTGQADVRDSNDSGLYDPVSGGRIDVSRSGSLHPHELDTAQRLMRAGHHIEFLPPSGTSRTPDVEMDGVGWELKSPTGSGKETIVQEVRRGRGQSSRLVIDLARTPLSVEAALAQVDQALRRYDGIEAIRIITRDGQLIERRP
jgi:hypothetical protein